MAEFLKWPEALHLSVTVLILFCVTAQTIALLMSGYGWPKYKNPARKLENALELTLLFMLFLFSHLHGHMIMIRNKTFLAPMGYGYCRIGIVFLLFALAVGIGVFRKRIWPSFTVLPALILLPLAETVAGKAYPSLFGLSLLFFLGRGIYVSRMRYREIRTGLSSWAVKDAMDTLHSGILFCEEDGHVLLINEKMQSLMFALTGKAHRNGLSFYHLLAARGDDAKNIFHEDGFICIAPDDTAWMFSKSIFTLGRKVFTQISAADVTEQWRLTGELKRQKEELSRKSEELKTTIADLQILSRKKETQAARMRAHDILGNRLSLILRSLRIGDLPDHDRLLSMTEGLFEELKNGAPHFAAKDELASLRETFLSIGVEIRLDGNLPEDTKIGKTFTKVIREAVTNAVRHGFATEVKIRAWSTAGAYHLAITDNGHAAPDEIVEGGGIGGMRKRITAHNGELHAFAVPCFTVSAVVPRGCENVQDADC